VTYGRDEWWRAAAGLGVLTGLVASVAFAADSALVAEGKRTRCPVDREMDRGSPTRAGDGRSRQETLENPDQSWLTS
jgi:hypothetical protein